MMTVGEAACARLGRKRHQAVPHAEISTRITQAGSSQRLEGLGEMDDRGFLRGIAMIYYPFT